MSSDSKLSTFYFSRDKRRCGLRVLKVEDRSVHGTPQGRLLNVAGREDSSRLSTLVTNTARGLFEMKAFNVDMLMGVREGRQKPVTVLPTVFEDEQDRRVRVTYKELVVRFKSGVNEATRKNLLGKFGFVENAKSPTIPDQIIATQPTVKYAGESLVAIANEITNTDEVLFSVPNFVSEFRRNKIPNPMTRQWHLNGGAFNAGLADAWKISTGSPEVTIAVLDDGVDLTHPDLAKRLLRNPDKSSKKDKYGRDFFVPPDQPDHFDPSPKRWQYPYDNMDGNDIHGTCCAGVALADGAGGKRVFGAAPDCRLLPVKVFHGNELCTDTRVAEAIRYAGKFARVLSLSWTGPQTPDIEFALGEDIGKEHGGRGAVVCAASGNGYANTVAYPAADPSCIAVGALTDGGVRADYSNYGPELSVVAPSGGGGKDIYTTDVSTANRGFKLGSEYTDDFSGTSSATPLVAGICALVLAANNKLARADVKTIIEGTARKVGPLPYVAGRNEEYGFGCVNAGAALAHPAVKTVSTAPKKKAKTKAKAKSKKKAKKAKGKK